MKQLMLFAILAAATIVQAENVTLGGVEYEVNTLIDRQIAPGVQYTRYRIPAYPLNINVLRVDLNNPWNSVETTLANGTACGTEGLVHAAERQTTPGHRAVAGANANFWVVSGGYDYPAYNGTTRNGSMSHGKIAIESNQYSDQFDGGTMRTGCISISDDRKMYIDRCISDISVYTEKTGVLSVYECNKGVKPNELTMYNDLYGRDRAFMPVTPNWQLENPGNITEVILDLDEGQEWACNELLQFTVAEVRTNAGTGTLGNHDLALVGRDYFRDAMALLAPGDKLTLRYNWTFRPDIPEQTVTPNLTDLVGGNSMVMIDGEITDNNYIQEYNSMVYSRCAYGRTADRKTMFICVIDKSTHPIYGSSAGCVTSIMCEFMQTLGCTDLSNCDAGGSAQMLINGEIINKTTESTPRAVGNGMLVYSTAPDDDVVASLAFDEISLCAPVFGRFCPKVIAYNQYGFPIDYDFRDFTLSCSDGLGTCDGTVFTASGNPGIGTITATAGDVSVSASLEVLQAEIGLRVKPLLIDGNRSYPVEVQAAIGQQTYTYDPASIDWAVADATIAEIGDDGVLRGLACGSTTLTGNIGDYSDSVDVTVEIPETHKVSYADWTEGWTVKGASGISAVKLSDEGKISYTYGSPRDAYLQMSKTLRLYALPDRLVVAFRSSQPVASLSLQLKAACADRAEVLVVSNGEAECFPAGEDVVVEIPVADFCDSADMASYPLSMQYLRFNLVRDSQYKGEQTITLADLRTEYDYMTDAVADIVRGTGSRLAVTPNPVAPGATICVDSERPISLVAPSGAVLARGHGSVKAPATPGLYIVTDGVSSAKIIVKND